MNKAMHMMKSRSRYTLQNDAELAIIFQERENAKNVYQRHECHQ